MASSLAPARPAAAPAGVAPQEPVPDGAFEATKSGWLEIYGAKLWNVANESKSFVACTLVAGVPFLLLLGLWTPAGLPQALTATAVAGAFAFLLVWQDYPLSLRTLLWGWLAVVGGLYVAEFGATALAAPVGLALGWFFFFTLFVWGFVYYHFLTKEPWSTTLNFWKLVMTNDDSTSGNFFQVIPQILAPALLWRLVAEGDGWSAPPMAAGALGVFAVAYGATWLLHERWHKVRRTRDHPAPEPLLPETRASKVLILNIDGCRADRARNPEDVPMPWLDHLAANGLEVHGMRTMYPARTSVGFSTILTGRPPKSHGVSSNFCFTPVKGESLFDRLEAHGKKGVALGIAHLYDIGHPNWNIHSVCSFVRNEEADDVFFTATKEVMLKENPDFMIVDLISVDQTGHMRGSTGDDYRNALMSTDEKIREFCGWLEERRFFDDGVLIVMSDHGQGRGIGGHGYWGEGEVHVPFIAYGKDVPKGVRRVEERSLMDVTPTVWRILGVDKKA